MSAGSRKKHSNAHKGYQAGADQLEVSALIAGAGNGRDVEQRLGRAIEGVTNLPTNEEGLVNADDLVKAGNELNASLKEIATLGNEGPVTAGNADTTQEGKNMSRLADAILKPEELDAALKAPRAELDLTAGGPIGYLPPHALVVPNKPHKGRNVITIVTRGVKSELFSTGFNDVVKHMLELAPHSISGLMTGFYLSADGMLEDNGASPELTVLERHGRPFDRALTEWSRRYNDYMRDKKKSVPASQRVSKLQEEDVTVDLFFIEPDESGKHALAAWQGTNVRPACYHGLESIRNLNASIREHNLSITLGGVFRRSEGVLEAAQKEFDKLTAALAVEPSTAG
jgi:hypothetical protein